MPLDVDRPVPARRGWHMPFWVLIAIMVAVAGVPLVMAAYVVLTV